MRKTKLTPWTRGQQRGKSGSIMTAPVVPHISVLATGRMPEPPTIYFTEVCAARIEYMVKKFDKELGWLCAVYPHPDHYPDVNPGYVLFDAEPIPNQEVTGATLEYEAADEGIAQDALMQRLAGHLTDGTLPAGVTVTTQCFSHSHVDMGVFSSGTDDDQMMQYSCNRAGELIDQYDYYIQTIHNKKGEVYAAIFDFRNRTHWESCQVKIIEKPLLSLDDMNALDATIDTFISPGRRITQAQDRYPMWREHAAYGGRLPDQNPPTMEFPNGTLCYGGKHDSNND